MTDDQRLKQFAGRALSTWKTVRHSFDCAERCIVEKIKGDFVECGVFAGTQSAAMAYACQKHSDDRLIHLFDSFQGIPQAGPKDDESITALIGPGSGQLKTTGVSACSVAQVQQHMLEWGIEPTRLKYHVGWFQQTVPVAKIDPIAILRLDGDLYESTKVCLEHFCRNVSSGGYVIIDDYALTGCRRAVHDYLDMSRMKPKIEKIEGGMGPVFWRA